MNFHEHNERDNDWLNGILFEIRLNNWVIIEKNAYFSEGIIEK